MADWKDFVEDNRERAGQFLDALSDRSRTRVEPVPPLLRCPVCVNVFPGEDLLDEHIRSVHGPQHVYLRVNGNVIREVAWAQHGIHAAVLVLIGHKNARVVVQTDGHTQTVLAGTDQDLTGCWPPQFEGEIHINVQPQAGMSRPFTLYNRTLPAFQQEELDRHLWNRLQEFNAHPSFPDLKQWQALSQEASALSQRYVSGFFEYTAGHALAACVQNGRFPPAEKG